MAKKYKSRRTFKLKSKPKYRKGSKKKNSNKQRKIKRKSYLKGGAGSTSLSEAAEKGTEEFPFTPRGSAYLGPGIRFKQFDDDVDPKQLEIFFNRFYDQLVRHKPHLTRLNFLSGASLYQVFKERFGSNYNLYTFITSKDFLELKSPSKKLPSEMVYENTDIPQQNQSGLKIPLNKSNSFVAYTQNQTTQLSLSRGEDVFITYKLYPGGKGISFKIIPFINTIYVLNNKDPNLSFIVSFYIYKKPINGKVASVSVYNIHRYRPGGNGTTLHTPDRKNTPEEAAVRAHESRKYLMNRQFDMYDHLYALEQYAEMIYKFFSAKVFRTKQDPNPSKLPDELFTRMTELAMQPQYSEEFVSVFNNMDKGVQSITELNRTELYNRPFKKIKN